jgi:predicted ferric reductase
MTVPLEPEMNRQSSSFGIASLIGIALAVALGLFAALVVFPDGSAQLAGSLIGTSPKAYWYMSRASAFVALGLLWISMMLGLLITDRLARSWPGAPVAFALHEFVSLLGLVFVLFHALILLGDRYINYQLAQILMPFGSINYHPVWVGLGQIGFYTWAIISASFYVRQRIGSKTWKFIHYVSFFNFIIAVLHGMASGTDSVLPWAQALYWILGGSVLFLTVGRVVAGLIQPKLPARPIPANIAHQSRQQS